MAGDRGLAFVLVGLIGATILWVGSARTLPRRAGPAYAAPFHTTVIKEIAPVRPVERGADGPSKARLAAALGLMPLE